MIGVLASIVAVAYSGVQDNARSSRIYTDLKNIKQAILRLEVDTGVTVFGCPGNGKTFGPEGYISTSASGLKAGLISVPTAGDINETCTWSSEAVAAWKGPYINYLTTPWNLPYYIDLDYSICENGSAKWIAAILSPGPNGSVNYPTSSTSGACTIASSDDTYLELYRP